VTLEDEQEHAADITRYIKSKLRLGNSKQAEALRSDIQEKSAGIFLWVALVIEILNKEYAGGRVSALRDRLRDIPPGLDELFEMILTRDGENMQELQLCIQWVLLRCALEATGAVLCDSFRGWPKHSDILGYR